MSWVPKTDFEREVLSMQPDHNFIFGRLAATENETFFPRPKSHLEFANKKKEQQKLISINPKLSIIAEVQAIAGTKPPGELPAITDWDTTDDVERETIAMMRRFGLGPSTEQPLTEDCTIATHPIPSSMHITKQGNQKRMPILYDDKYFDFDNQNGLFGASENENETEAAAAIPMDEDDEQENLIENAVQLTPKKPTKVAFLRNLEHKTKIYNGDNRKKNDRKNLSPRFYKEEKEKRTNDGRQRYSGRNERHDDADDEYIPTLNFYNSKSSSLFDSDQSSTSKNSNTSSTSRGNERSDYIRRFYSPTEIYNNKRNKK